MIGTIEVLGHFPIQTSNDADIKVALVKFLWAKIPVRTCCKTVLIFDRNIKRIAVLSQGNIAYIIDKQICNV